MLKMIIQGELTSRLTHILFVPALLFFTCNSKPSASEPPSYHQSSLPIVNALIEERPVRCLVASGTSITIVDERILGPNQRFATERLKITDVNGVPVFARLAEGLHLECGGFSTLLTRAGVLDLTELSKRHGVEFDAILGDDVLHAAVLNLSPEKIWLTAEFEDDQDQFDTSPLKYENGHPIIPVRLHGLGTRDFEVHTDVGLTVTFSDKTYQRLLELKQASDAGQNWLRLNNFGNPKEVSRQRVVCSGLTIGSSRFTNVPGYIRERNVLGAGLLMNMRVSIDGKSGLLYVQRNTNTHIDWFPRNDSGIMFTFPDSSRLLIDSLIEKSPGTQAGLEANDEILSIEGKSPRELTVDSVRSYLSQSDTPVRIVYSRNGKQHETMLSIPKTYEYPPKWDKSPEEKAREFFERME